MYPQVQDLLRPPSFKMAFEAPFILLSHCSLGADPMDRLAAERLRRLRVSRRGAWTGKAHAVSQNASWNFPLTCKSPSMYSIPL